MNGTAYQWGRSGRLLRDGGDTALRDLRRGQCRLEVQAGPDREGSCSFTGKQAPMGSGTECKIHMDSKTEHRTSKKLHAVKQF